MKKKENNNLLLIGAAILIYFLFIKKEKKDQDGGGGGGASSGGGLFSNVSPQQRARIKADVNKEVQKINIEPEVNEDEYFKKQYQDGIKLCKI